MLEMLENEKEQGTTRFSSSSLMIVSMVIILHTKQRLLFHLFGLFLLVN